jgi:glycerol uptake facilitator-like aquaporin
MLAVMVLLAATEAGTEAKLTRPVEASYVPTPSTGLMTDTPPRPGESCSVKLGLTAALPETLAKLAVALTVVPTGAEVGSCTEAAISEARTTMGTVAVSQTVGAACAQIWYVTE